MDEHRWNLDTGKYAPNTHALSRWHYDDRETQLERYGRACGVLQPIFDPLADADELGIFVNTNKTQMWDPGRKTGYEIPWPSAVANADAPPEIQEDLLAMERPYTILKQQLRWQDEYNPSPEPVGFLDLPEDSNSVSEKYEDRLPQFTPVFADISTEDYRDHTPIFPPVREEKLHRLFHAIAVETERRLKAEGQRVTLTAPAPGGTRSKLAYQGRLCIFDIHSLRVAGISRLIEMGVPVHIVQEFIAGHVTIVATDYYRKIEGGHARQQLRDKWSEADILADWDRLREPLSARPDLWVFNHRFASHRPADLLDVFAGWKLVPGGICPLGGTGCEIGQPIEDDEEDKTIRGQYGPVVGGCGNCRFFSTGPAFVIQQGQCLNELMLELRVIGRDRKALHASRMELDWKDEPNMPSAKRQRLRLERETIVEQIRAADCKMAPLILEWVNRIAMRRESVELMEQWRKFALSADATPPEHLSAVLLAGASAAEIKVELESRLERGGDFALVRNILETAKLRGGLAKASTLAKDTCRDFIDRILRVEDARYLLIDIPDEQMRNEAAFLMASFASQQLGDKAVQEAVDGRSPLPLDAVRRDEFMQWVSATIDVARKGRAVGELEGMLPRFLLEDMGGTK